MGLNGSVVKEHSPSPSSPPLSSLFSSPLLSSLPHSSLPPFEEVRELGLYLYVFTFCLIVYLELTFYAKGRSTREVDFSAVSTETIYKVLCDMYLSSRPAALLWFC